MPAKPSFNSLSGDLTESELYVGVEMRGYRAWIADWDGTTPVLRPIHRARTQSWKPGINTAECYANGLAADKPTADLYHRGQKPPVAGCGCGFWSYAEGDNFNPFHRRHLYADPYASSLLTGVIRATGEIVQAEDGFRAEHAEVVALAPPLRVAPELELIRNSPAWGHGGLFYSAINHSGYCHCFWCSAARGNKPPTMAQVAEQYNVPYYDSYRAMVVAHPPTHKNPVKQPLTFFDLGGAVPLITPVLPVPQKNPSNNAMSALQMLAHGINTILSQVVKSVTGWPAQPDFTGTSSEVVKKWWCWSLTGKTSVTLENEQDG